MKLFSQRGEIQLLKTLGSERISPKQRLSILGKLDKSMFHLKPTRQAYMRFRSVAKKTMQVMDWEELLQDSGFESEYRDILEDSADIKPLRNPKKAKVLVASLDQFRKVRALYDIAKDIGNELSEDKVDVDVLFEEVGIALGKANRSLSSEQTVYNIGVNDNVVDKLLDKMLDDPDEAMFKTGFNQYDNINGGVPTEGVFILSSTTSGGKSVLSTNLLRRIHEINKVDVLRMSLEMSIEQELKRICAMETGILFSKIKQGKVSSKEKAQIRKALKAWSKKSKKNKTRFSIITPDKSMTTEEALSMIRPFDYKVVCLDYIGLFEGVGGDNQWQKLGECVRQCKIFSKEAKCLVIVLAQLDGKSDSLRYSQAMKEHADVMWQWNYSDPEVRAEKIIHMVTGKARDGELIEFDLMEKYEYMTVSNMPTNGTGFATGISNNDDSDDELSDDSDDEEETKSSKKKKKKKKISKSKSKSKSKFVLE